MSEESIEAVTPDAEPVHGWFGLSYASYAVFPRSMLQSMPPEWQSRFVELLHEMESALSHHAAAGDYVVKFRDENRRFVQDPLKDYQRGRRRLQSELEATK